MGNPILYKLKQGIHNSSGALVHINDCAGHRLEAGSVVLAEWDF